MLLLPLLPLLPLLLLLLVLLPHPESGEPMRAVPGPMWATPGAQCTGGIDV